MWPYGVIPYRTGEPCLYLQRMMHPGILCNAVALGKGLDDEDEDAHYRQLKNIKSYNIDYRS